MTKLERIEYQRKWRIANKDKLKEYATRYKNYRIAYYKKYRQENKTNIRKSQKIWRENNPEKCRKYYRNNGLKLYGITPTDYDALLKSQGGKCAICKRPSSDFKRRLHVDHDHTTNKIRGLLCVKCNQGIGYFNDCPELLQQARKYLSDTILVSSYRSGISTR